MATEVSGFFRCRLCNQHQGGMVFKADVPVCPKCKSEGEPFVVEIVPIHLIVMDARGPISGHFGRQFVACEPNRAALAQFPGDVFSASDDPRAITCPDCLATPHYKAAAAPYLQGRNAAHHRFIIDPRAEGCCG